MSGPFWETSWPIRLQILLPLLFSVPSPGTPITCMLHLPTVSCVPYALIYIFHYFFLFGQSFYEPVSTHSLHCSAEFPVEHISAFFTVVIVYFISSIFITHSDNEIHVTWVIALKLEWENWVPRIHREVFCDDGSSHPSSPSAIWTHNTLLSI